VLVGCGRVAIGHALETAPTASRSQSRLPPQHVLGRPEIVLSNGTLRPTTNKDSTTARGTALPTLRDFDPAYDLSGPNLRLRTRMGFAVASRILKGEKPTDCRFCRATRFEQTMLGIELPPTLLGPRTSVAIRPSFVAVHDSGGA
jgi:hypothetical protein